MFKKFENYLKKVGDEIGEKKDFTPYFEQKAGLLKGRLFHYIKELDSISEALGGGYYKSRKYASSGEMQVDDDILIIVFKKFLSDDYSPPTEPADLQLHLYALFYFYKFIRPSAAIHLDILLKLDIATLKIISITANMTGWIPSAKKGYNQKTAVKQGREEVGNKNKEMIRKAFTDYLKAEWIGKEDDKKPILIKGVRYSVNRVATEYLPMQLSETFDPKTIYKHLKALHKDGKI